MKTASAKPLKPDKSIESDLRLRLKRSKLSLDSVLFSVKDGAVTWTGTVSVPQRKGAATRIAKSAGATRVLNQIRIGGIASSKPAKLAPRGVRIGVPPAK